MEINAHTELYCILGNPVRHSLSPVIHNTAFRSSGTNAVYLAFTPVNLKEGIQALRTLGIRGASITIPYKIEVLKLLDQIDPMAEAIGSVNTLLLENGRLSGYNTDAYGAVKPMLEREIPIEKSQFLVIGNGGAARAVAYSILHRGGAVAITGRNSNNIARFAEELRGAFPDRVAYRQISALDRTFMTEIDVIINTTPVGMAPDPARAPIDPSLLRKEHVVFDIVYTPHETLLLREAKKRRCDIIHGIEMLIHQGARQFEIWTGRTAPLKEIHSALKRHLRSRT
ncbi:MAG: shikimate dehydrogenase [Spirochaetes bacterium]|nr:shikimate dehydrogenase [Spirochaetota bacterium]